MIFNPEIQEILNQEKYEVHIMNLCRLAAIDGNLHPNETKIIHKLADSYGIKDEDLEDIFDNPPPDWKLMDVKSTKKKLRFIFDLILLMMADDAMEDEELEFCKSVASRMGVWDDLFDDIFRRMSELTYQTQDKEEIVLIVNQEFGNQMI